MEAPRFLIVDDDPPVARAIERMLRNSGQRVIASTAKEARSLLPQPWTGFIIDIGLPDGSGLDIAREARVFHPSVAIMILTGSIERTFLQAAYEIRASYLTKPAKQRDFTHFTTRAIAQQQQTTDRVFRVIDEWQRLYGLSVSEIELLRMAVMGYERARMPELRGVVSSTIKKQVSSLLHKTKDTTLEHATNRLLRAALSQSA